MNSVKDVVRIRQKHEEGWRTYWPKRCENNNKDEDNNPKTLNGKNQASSQTTKIFFFKTVQAKFHRKFNFNNYPRKAKFIVR